MKKIRWTSQIKMVGNEVNDPVIYQSLIDCDLEDLLQWREDYKYSIFSLLDDFFLKTH